MADTSGLASAVTVEPSLAAKYLCELLLPVMRHRVKAMGLTEAGAYDFYGFRLESLVVLPDFEIALVEAIKRELPDLTEIHEIGCGWGQLVFLLAWSGFDTVGFEIDPRRFAAAEQFRQILSLVDEPRTRRARFLNEFFPPLLRPRRYGSLAVCDNIVIENPKYLEEQLIWSLARYQHCIFNLDRFCQVRGAVDRPALVARFEAAGLTNRGILCDADRFGAFYLFERDEARPVRSPARADRASSNNLPASVELVRDAAAKVLRERIDRLGVEASGAEKHYSLMLARGFPLPNYELAVIEAIDNHLSGFERYCEIGSGLATLSLLLAVHGYRSLALEKNRGRHKTASLIWQELRGAARLERRQCTLVLGAFPKVARKFDVSHSLAILTDFVTLQSQAEMDAIFAGLTRFAAVLVDLQRFQIKRERREEREALVAELQRRGFRFERLFRDPTDNDYSLALFKPTVVADR